MDSHLRDTARGSRLQSNAARQELSPSQTAHRPIVRYDPRAYRRGIPRPVLYYLLAVLVYALVFGLWQAQPVPIEVHFAGILAAAICMFPMALWYAQGSKGVPLFEVICIDYLVQFANPVYLQKNSYLVFSVAEVYTWDETFRALLLVSLGMAAMIAAYYTTRRLPLRRKIPQIDLPFQLEGRQRYIVSAIVFGLTTSILATFHLTPDNSGPLGSLIRLLSAQYTIGIVLLAYPFYRGEIRHPAWGYLLYGSIVVSVLLGLAGGSLEPAISPLAIIFLIRWHTSRRFPLNWIALAFVGFVLLQSIKAEYRQQMATQNLSGSTRITLWFQDAQDTLGPLFTGDVLTNLQTLTRSSMSRFDTFHVFEHVYTWTPSIVPYYGGSSYTYFLITWIPRTVWPDKPNASDFNIQFELDYHLLSTFQTSGASIGLGQLTEGYANFGILGIPIVMALEGVVIALMDAAFNGPESEGGRALYLVLMVSLLNGIGAQTAVIFGSLVQNALGSAVILRLFAAGWKARRSEDEPAHRHSRRRRIESEPSRGGP